MAEAYFTHAQNGREDNVTRERVIEEGEIPEVCPCGYCDGEPNNEVTDSSDSNSDMNSEDMDMSSDNELNLTAECQVRQMVSDSMNADVMYMPETFTPFQACAFELDYTLRIVENTTALTQIYDINEQPLQPLYTQAPTPLPTLEEVPTAPPLSPTTLTLPSQLPNFPQLNGQQQEQDNLHQVHEQQQVDATPTSEQGLYSLYAQEDTLVEASCTAKVLKTNLTVALPKGTVGFIIGEVALLQTTPLRIHNTIITNTKPETVQCFASIDSNTRRTATVVKGMKLARLVVIKLEYAEMTMEELGVVNPPAPNLTCYESHIAEHFFG